jgi:hypothetical protein
MVDRFIFNNGSCVLLAGTEGDKAKLISSLLCQFIRPEEGAFSHGGDKKKRTSSSKL